MTNFGWTPFSGPIEKMTKFKMTTKFGQQSFLITNKLSAAFQSLLKFLKQAILAMSKYITLNIYLGHDTSKWISYN